MKNLIFILSFAAMALMTNGCGVKGDPRPPLTPAALGHGQPSFKRTTKLAPVPTDSEPAPRKTEESDQE